MWSSNNSKNSCTTTPIPSDNKIYLSFELDLSIKLSMKNNTAKIQKENFFLLLFAVI